MYSCTFAGCRNVSLKRRLKGENFVGYSVAEESRKKTENCSSAVAVRMRKREGPRNQMVVGRGNCRCETDEYFKAVGSTTADDRLMITEAGCGDSGGDCGGVSVVAEGAPVVLGRAREVVKECWWSWRGEGSPGGVQAVTEE